MGSGVTVRNGRFPVQTPLPARPGFGTQPCYESPADLRVEISQKRSDQHQVNETAPSTVAQSWPWGNQIAF